MSFETGHCEACDCPIGSGSCGGCIAYAAVLSQEEYPDEEIEGDWPGDWEPLDGEE